MIEVQQYIETFKDFPLLSAKEERRLLEIIRTPPEGVPEDAEDWVLTPEQVEARDEFIYRNIRLVIHTAKKFCKMEDPRMMDLICAGVYGMVHALSKFDISLGYRFSTFAVWWIRAKIGNELKAQDNKAIRYKTLHQKFKKCRNQYTKVGIFKSEEDIFKELEWTEVEISRYKEDVARLSISLDTIDTSLNDFASCDDV
jgi:RNA polymerase sigma factor (sigma-70 family)